MITKMLTTAENQIIFTPLFFFSINSLILLFNTKKKSLKIVGSEKETEKQKQNNKKD